MSLLKIPFYKSEGDPNRCYEASMKSVLKYFFPEKDFSFEELDELVGRKPRMWTYTHQIVPVLHDLGLSVIFCSTDPMDSLSSVKSFMELLKKYKTQESIDHVLKNTDVETVVNAAVKCKQYDLFEHKRLAFSEIQRHLDQGHIPMMLLDRNILIGKKGPYQGHFVVVTGYDDNFVYYHENLEKAPKSNAKVRKDVFVKAWDNSGTGNDVVLVVGMADNSKS